MRKILYLLVTAAMVHTASAQQDTLSLTLQDAIRIARDNSPAAIAARHSFRASYWNYRSFRANYLPSLTFTSTPVLDRAINKVTQPDGSELFREQNRLSIDGAMTINQNVSFLGGSVFLKTSLQRIDNLVDKTISYQSSPIVVGYEQNLLGYNSLKWNKKIEPIRYKEAQKYYVETLEMVSANTVQKFFSLATAQSNLETAKFNYANADTLYRYAQGRYNIGTITENEMLQLEINKLTEETNVMNANIEMDDCIQDFRSYLGINKGVAIRVDVDDAVPRFKVNLEEAMRLAYENNSEIESMQRRKLQSESDVAYAKSQTGFQANLYAQFGLTQTSSDIDKAYRDPQNQQYVSLGIRIPILDWGVGKGKVRVAKSNRDKVYTQLEQDKSDFDLNIMKVVKQFNLQAEKVAIAAKTDATALRRHEVARKLYLLGKSTVLDLNASISEKDSARRAYINSLYNYWSLLYTLRSLTLYNFEDNDSITEDYKTLLK